MWSLEDIQERIKSHSLFHPDQFVGVDCDTLLNFRDQSPFSSRWAEAERSVAAARRRLPAEAAHAEEINAVREYVFRHVFLATGQHDDMAAYASDDFGLICEAAVSECWPEVVVALAECYREHQLPAEL